MSRLVTTPGRNPARAEPPQPVVAPLPRWQRSRIVQSDVLNVVITGVRAEPNAAAGKAGTVRLTRHAEVTWAQITLPNYEFITGVRSQTNPAAGKAGTVRFDSNITGVRSTPNTAAAKTGTVRFDVNVTGVRAQANPAAGKAGAPSVRTDVFVTGVRSTPNPAAAKTGSPLVAVTGTQVAATAAGKVGTLVLTRHVEVTWAQIRVPTYEFVTGVRSVTNPVAGKAGSPAVRVTGVRGGAIAAGKAGTLNSTRAVRVTWASMIVPVAAANVSITGVRGLATAAGKSGSPKIVVAPDHFAVVVIGDPNIGEELSVEFTSTIAYTSGKPGTLFTGNVVPGTRGLASAAGQAGAPKVSLQARASATAAGKVGTLRFDCRITGARGLAVASGTAGAVQLGGSRVIAGVRGFATAAGKPGAIVYTAVVFGSRGLASATGKPGTVIYTARVPGARGAAVAAGSPGSTTTVAAAGQVLTPWTRANTQQGITEAPTETETTIADVLTGKTLAVIGNGRTRVTVRNG